MSLNRAATIASRSGASSSVVAQRAISTSRPARDAHGDHHGHEQATGAPETFFSPIWRNTLILTAVAVIAYPFLPSPPSKAMSPTTTDAYSTSESKDLPLVSRVLARLTTPASTWKERNDKHLELTIKAAEDKLLFQEAERPKIYRMRFPSSFENASPHGISVGSQIDLSDLVVKGDAPQVIPDNA